MSNLHQKKFYSSKQVDKIIEQHAKETRQGYSEALRDIVEMFHVARVIYGEPFIKTETRPTDEYWKTQAGIEQSR